MMRKVMAVAVAGLAAVASTYLFVRAVVKNGFGFLYSVTATLVTLSYTAFGVSLYALINSLRRRGRDT